MLSAGKRYRKQEVMKETKWKRNDQGKVNKTVWEQEDKFTLKKTKTRTRGW